MTTYIVNNTEQEKKIYCGREYEHNLTTNTQYNYIYVGNIPVALYVQGDSNAMYTLHTNHLGSIEKITDKNGHVVDSMSYTPFGLRRSVTDWTRNDTDTRFTDRGFTGQQHLDNFALINFNGRMYDPVLAHFLSPDPYIQNPENPLNYNRYAYCLFSPLQYVDPSGDTIMIKCPETGNTILYTLGMKVPEGSSRFVSDAITGLNFLHDNPEGNINRIADLVEAKNILTIMKGSGNIGSDGDGYRPMYRELRWNNDLAAILPDGTGHAPIVSLAHEIDHASFSIPAWDVADSYNQMNAEANSNAFMLQEDVRYDSWEQKAVNYENFIGSKTVNGNKLATYRRELYVVPKGMTLKPVESIFLIK